MAHVVLDRLSKVFTGGIPAVRDLSLTIADGEFVVLVGPSGCGKTTTLRLIAGLEEPTSGTIRLGDRVVNGIPPRDRDIAMVFQNYALYPHMTARQNIAFALKMRRMPRPEIARRVDDATRLLGIQELLDRRPRELSGGQRQRVALARAMVREPKAFLYDEPLSNLDPKLRITTRGELKALHQRLRTTTIYVTHDQEEAMTLGDRIVVLHAGQVQQVGPPLDVYRHPANRFVASFIGMPPLNFLDGRLEQHTSGLAFIEAGPGGATLPLLPHQADRAANLAGSPVVLGVRPQSLGLAAGGPAIPVKVEVVEPLGESVDLVCSTAAGHRLLARLPGAQEELPERLAVDMPAAHLFEPGEFGRAVF